MDLAYDHRIKPRPTKNGVTPHQTMRNANTSRTNGGTREKKGDTFNGDPYSSDLAAKLGSPSEHTR
eukprot:3408986-Amphidinium_carterae.1